MSSGYQELLNMRGRTVYDRDGEKIGSVEDIYCDNESGTPEWIGIGTGIFKTKHVTVPVEGYSIRGDGVCVPYSKDQVKDAPDVDGDEIAQDRENELYEYYGLRQQGFQQPTETYNPAQYRAAGTDQGAAGADRGVAGDRDQTSMTRSEEEMRIGKQNVDAGRVRLRKWVETEPVSEDVRLRRETARIERQPLNEPVTNADLGEREIEVNLQREEPVVE